MEGGGGGEEEEGQKQNGLINTHKIGAEPVEVVLYPGRQEPCRALPQLLNPSTLLPHQGVSDATLGPTPGLLLYPDGILQVLGEAGGGDCCETTFIEGHAHDSSPSVAACSTKEVLLFADGKFLEFSGEEARIHTLSYDIDDEDDFQELEVRSNRFYSEM